MNTLIPVFLQLGAFVIIMIEWVIPSFGILTLLSLGFFAYSWYYIVQNLPFMAVTIFAAADVMMVPVGLYIGLRIFKSSPLTNRNMLKKGTGLENESTDFGELIGRKGVTQTPLRPVGKVLVGEKILEATTDGEMLEKNKNVVITQIKGMNIFVEETNPN